MVMRRSRSLRPSAPLLRQSGASKPGPTEAYGGLNPHAAAFTPHHDQSGKHDTLSMPTQLNRT